MYHIQTEEQRTKREAKEEKARKKAEAEAKAEEQKQKSARMMSNFFGRAPASSPIRAESKRDRSASRSSRESSFLIGQALEMIKVGLMGCFGLINRQPRRIERTAVRFLRRLQAVPSRHECFARSGRQI
jgi:hypothetical protein